MKLTRNAKIAIFYSALIIICGSIITYNVATWDGPLFVSDAYDWEITIKGAIEEEVSISYYDIVSGVYDKVEDKEFYSINSYDTEKTSTLTGVTVESILRDSGVQLFSNATGIKFIAIDDYSSQVLPLESVTGDKVILAYKQNGEFLETKTQGGDGPIISAVDFSLTDPEPNQPYFVKYTLTIEVVAE